MDDADDFLRAYAVAKPGTELVVKPVASRSHPYDRRVFVSVGSRVMRLKPRVALDIAEQAISAAWNQGPATEHMVALATALRHAADMCDHSVMETMQ